MMLSSVHLRAHTLRTPFALPRHQTRVTHPRHGNTGGRRTFITALSDQLLDLAIALPLPPSLPPYSTTIILATVATRLCLLPVSLWARKRMLFAEEVVVPQIRAVQSKVAQDVLTQMRSERVAGTKEEIIKEHNKRTTAAMKVQRKRLLADNKVSPWQTSLLPVLAQLPLFVLSSVTFYNMCQSPTPLDAESFLTLTSLSHPDPTSVLPIAVGIITFANIESSGWFRTEGEIERERKVAEWTKERQAGGETVVKPRAIIQGVLRLASVGRIVWAATLPGGVVLYWLTSSIFGLLQTWGIEWWAARRRLTIAPETTAPPIVPSPPAPVGKKSRSGRQ